MKIRKKSLSRNIGFTGLVLVLAALTWYNSNLDFKSEGQKQVDALGVTVLGTDIYFDNFPKWEYTRARPSEVAGLNDDFTKALDKELFTMFQDMKGRYHFFFSYSAKDKYGHEKEQAYMYLGQLDANELNKYIDFKTWNENDGVTQIILREMKK